MSADELSDLNLKDDFQEARKVEDASRWKLEMPASMEIFATMGSTLIKDEHFQARLLWRLYPIEAPSLKFRDPITGKLDLPTAWPIVRGFRPTSLDACVSWCIEGFDLHPEWKNDARYQWDPRGNVLLKVLRILQYELDNFCQGRNK